MSRLMITSDLHLGHNNIHKYRDQFSTAEEHHNTVFENLATTIRKNDTLYLLGDIAFTQEWLDKISSINCRYKLLICGNHDTERGITMKHLVNAYDDVRALMTKRNYWFSHAPIHPDEMRGRLACVHGHLHSRKIQQEYMGDGDYVGEVDDRRYINACVEHTDYKPITFEDLIAQQD